MVNAKQKRVIQNTPVERINDVKESPKQIEEAGSVPDNKVIIQYNLISETHYGQISPEEAPPP